MTNSNQTPHWALVSTAALLVTWSYEEEEETGEWMREMAYQIRLNADAMQKEIKWLKESL
jgi:hypothetical protein